MAEVRMLAVAGAVAALLAAMPAAAVVKVATYTGTVASGIDLTGVFGTANTDLTGAGWVATYTYDRSLGGYQFTDGSSLDISYGGATHGYPGALPIISATLTINGVTKAFQGTDYSYVSTWTYPIVQHISEEEYISSSIHFYHYLANYAFAAGAPASLDQNFGPVASTVGHGYMEWGLQTFPTGTFAEYARADLGDASVYSVTDFVPEPASWALMIAGFGMIGAALRRRRTSAIA